jgi:hypothetical protein
VNLKGSFGPDLLSSAVGDNLITLGNLGVVEVAPGNLPVALSRSWVN